MFDDKNNAPLGAPNNLPIEAEDMFQNVDRSDASDAPPRAPDALAAGVLKRKVEPSPASLPDNQAIQTIPSLDALTSTRGPILGKVLLFVFIAIVIGAVGFGGWWLYTNNGSPKTASSRTGVPATSPTKTTDQKNDSNIVVDNPTVLPSATSSAVIVIPAINTSSTSSSSTAATTATNTIKAKNDTLLFGESIDSDKDGLDDAREKEIGTNITNGDTDADGLSDGDEVIIWKTNPLKTDTDGDSYPDGTEVRNGYNPLGSGRLFNTAVSATTTAAKNSSTKK